MKFSCYSKEEGMDPCTGQCDFCKDHYAKPVTKNPTNREDNYHNRPTHTVTVRIPTDTYTKLKKLAKLDNRNLNNLINTMILNELEEINYDFNKYIIDESDEKA